MTMIKRRIDFAALPPLTAEVKAQLAALAAKGDEDIDLSDIPELDESFWQNAKRVHFYRPGL